MFLKWGNAYGHVSQRNPSYCDIKGLTAKFEDDCNGQDSSLDMTEITNQRNVSGFSQLELVQTEIS